MRIAVISDTVRPTLPDGPHGLGRSAHDIARGLAQWGHKVTLFAAAGSSFEHGALATGENEAALVGALLGHEPFEVVLDTGHHHQLSAMRPEMPVLNRVCDLECVYRPPCAVVNSPFMQRRYKGARLVATGIDVEAVPYYEERGEYAAFVGPVGEAQRGYAEAQRVAEMAGMLLVPIDGLAGAEKWQAFGRARVLLTPSTLRAAPRTPLEFAALGVPTLCLAGDGAEWHVAHGVSGFVCRNLDEMAHALVSVRVASLSRAAMREWVAEAHGYERMVDSYETLLAAIAEGERW